MLCRSFLILFSAPLLAAAQTAAADYTPTFSRCPSDLSLVRLTGPSPDQQTLSPGESGYVKSRRLNVIPNAWKTYLSNVLSTNVSLPDYVSNILSGDSVGGPNFAISVSGGGYRAAIFGAGVLNALDGRNTSSANAGMGGLLQAATYVAGLSGGSWLLTSLTQANFPTIQDLIFGSSDPSAYAGWLTQVDVFAPSTDLATNLGYIESLVGEVSGKHAAGFRVTLVDLWARGLSRHFLNGTTVQNIFDPSIHGAGITFSGLANVPSFISNSQPFPLLVADIQSINGDASHIEASDDLVPLSNPLFEFNVYEMGSFDPVLSAFTPTQYLGSQNNSICVSGFDQAGFIMGTSSAIFNDYNTSDTAFANSIVGPVVEILNASIPQQGVELDSSQFPNPFLGVANSTFIASNEEFLELVDGGEDGEVIPLQPLLVKAREVDVILAIDASSGINNFANGTALITSWNRTTLFPSAYSFPPIPSDALTFTSQNLTTRPTFFGCDSDPSAPLLIYLANGGPPRSDPVAVTNTPTGQLNYLPSQIQAMVDQTFAIATQGLAANASVAPDPEWAACLACAIVDRARSRAGTERSGVCTSCFGRYCWSP